LVTTTDELREQAKVLLAAVEALRAGRSMESRGHLERQVKEVVREGLALWGPHEAGAHIASPILNLCKGDSDLAQRLTSEAAAELSAARMIEMDDNKRRT
jgi:hypothetical protein